MILSKSQVKYIDHMGTDKSVVNAARVSFDADSSEESFSERDQKLIGYLAKHRHWSPFAHTSIQLKISAPIFVARQLVKHQVGGVWNEVSRRYVSYEPRMFDFESFRGKPQNAKQGSDGEIDNPELVEKALEFYDQSLVFYNSLLEAGVCPEQARMFLPLSSMTDWYWTGSLVFWARVCEQRLDAHAQKETRDIAQQIKDICFELFPVSWGALMEQTTATQ
jgi:thymidylate synthase (FAD)